MAETYKSLKVPTWVYDNAQQMRGDLVRRGIAVVPDRLLVPRQCPRCQKPVDLVATAVVSVEHVSCSCGYQVQTLTANGNVVAQIGLGVLLGLGIAALASALDGPPPRPAALYKKTAKKRARRVAIR
jgi:hypothetical protein